MNILALSTFFKRRVIDAMTLEQTRRRLLSLDDRALEDIGLVRELLEEGIKAYPWHADAVAPTPKVPDFMPSEQGQTVRLARSKQQLPLQISGYYN